MGVSALTQYTVLARLWDCVFLLFFVVVFDSTKQAQQQQQKKKKERRKKREEGEEEEERGEHTAEREAEEGRIYIFYILFLDFSLIV